MKHKESKGNSILLELFDTLFIMILCFGTLLSAMLMKGEVIGGMKYSIDFKSFIITILGLVVYLCFILPQSDKGLRKMIKQLYEDTGDNK